MTDWLGIARARENPSCPHRNRKFADSLLEEGVMCELVSESPKFPDSREKTGNFHRLALRSRQMMPNTGADTMTYGKIPYASEQGIFSA